MITTHDCWVVTDGAAGNERQAVALAQALGHTPRVLRASLKAPWRWLAPSGPRDPRAAMSQLEGGPIQPPWPALVVGCGRIGAGVSLGIGRLSEGRSRLVQILDPRRHRKRFDALVVPGHDGVSGSNVIRTLGALNRIDDAWLHAARDAFAEIAHLPSPRIALLIGGPTRNFPLDAAYVDELVAALERSRPAPASWLVTCSRRTPPALAQRLRQHMRNRPGLFWADDGDGPNPYAGLLAWADAVVVTPDSTNLLSEACATGTPVFVLDSGKVTGKARALLAALRETSRVRSLPFDSLDWRYPPLRELEAVAAQVRERLNLSQPNRQLANSVAEYPTKSR